MINIFYKVTARQEGDSVQFDISADDIKSALETGREKATEIFDVANGKINVSVKEIKNKNKED